MEEWQDKVDSYPEAVFVRGPDGKSAVYRPEEVSPERDDVYARKLADGYIVYYAGPDAGPRSDPAAWVPLRDLAGPDGTVPTLPGPNKLLGRKKPTDTGSP